MSRTYMTGEWEESWEVQMQLSSVMLDGASIPMDLWATVRTFETQGQAWSFLNTFKTNNALRVVRVNKTVYLNRW